MHQFGMAQAGARQAGVVVGVEGNGQVELVRQQALHQLGAVVGVDVEGDAGLGVAAGAHHAGQQAQAESRRAAQPQVAVGAVAQAGGQPAHAAEVLVQARHLGRQDFGFARGHQAPLDPLEQLEPELGLGVRQQLAGRGLRNMQAAAASVSDPVRRMASKISMWRRRMAQTRDGKCDSMPRRVRRCRTACLSCAVGPA